MADPDNMEAKHLLADTFEQLGYQAESANWRNMYLAGAMELRNGVNKEVQAYDSSAVFNKVSVDDFLKLLAIKLNGPKANGKKITVNVTITDTNEEFVLFLENSVLSRKMDVLDDNPDISLHVDKFTLYGMGNGRLAPAQALADRKLEISGELNKWNEFLSLLDSFNPLVNIVTP